MNNLLATLLLFACLGAAASVPAPARDPLLERRVSALAEQLRCVVCQNQTIADSQAELAVDLRQQVREKLAQGMSEEQVRDYVVARYGDFVLYRPPLKGATVVLWFAPALLLAGGMLALRKKVLAQRKAAASPPSPELARCAALLDGDPERP